MTRWRARADQLASRYEELARTRPLLGLPIVFFARYVERQGALLASALAFRLFLWLMPLSLLAAGILAALTGDHASSIESASRGAGVTGAASQEIVEALQGGRRSWWVAVVVGATLVAWTSRTLVRNLAIVNAHAWQAPIPKQRPKTVALSAAVFVCGWIVLLAIAATITSLDRSMSGGIILSVAVETLVVAGAWLAIASRLPDKRTTWTDLIPGCLLVGVGATILHAASQIYLPHKLSSASQLYGTLGLAATILAWLLIVAQLVVSAALVNAMWAEHRSRRCQPAESQQDD